MYAEIIPQIKTPKSIGVFDYLVPKNMAIKTGDLVQVEFRRSKIIGLVWNLKKTTSLAKVKPILAKVNDLSLTPKQCQLLTWLEKYYYISPPLALKTLLPEIPQKKSQFKIINFFNEKTIISKSRLPAVKAVIDKLATCSKPVIFHYSSPAEKIAVISGLLKRLKKQALVIEPEIQNIFSLANSNKKLDIGLIHSGLSKTQVFNEWTKFKNNQRDIIIGTKKAVFFPFDNLEYLIIDDEEEKSQKNFDQNPRYQVLAVAEQIKKINPGVKLILTSQCPDLEIWDKYPHVELLQKINPAEIIDLNLEKTMGNYSYFSEKLNEQIAKSKKIFLLFNRKGEFNHLVCRDCGQVTKFDSKPVNCPKCNSLNLKKASYGTTKLLKELSGIFPDKKMVEITKDDDKADFTTADIVIGTDFALKKIDPDNFDLMAVISIDHELAIPEYQSAEKVFQKIIKLINFKKLLFIQTHAPQNPAIRFGANLQFHDFYKQEAEFRKMLNYPPFGNLIKVINKKNKQEKIVKSDEELRKLADSDDYIIDRM